MHNVRNWNNCFDLSTANLDKSNPQLTSSTRTHIYMYVHTVHIRTNEPNRLLNEQRNPFVVRSFDELNQHEELKQLDSSGISWNNGKI